MTSPYLTRVTRKILVWAMMMSWSVPVMVSCDDNSSFRRELEEGADLMAGQDVDEAGDTVHQVIEAGAQSGGQASDQMISGMQGENPIEAGIAEAGMIETDDPMNSMMTHTFPPAPLDYPQFSFPIHEDDRDLMKANPVFGFDHDPREGNRIQCTDYAGRGFPHCYDGHEGSDFMLEGGFETMDIGSARVVAALAGEVVAVEDGNYDRCHADLFSADVSCDGYPMRSNFVRIRHDNNWVSLYYHLKNGSVTVQRGQRVSCGEELGRVGSSGYSSSPHLHFEVKDPDGTRWDPFAGSESQDFSLWEYQPELVSDEAVLVSSASLPSNSCSSPSR